MRQSRFDNKVANANKTNYIYCTLGEKYIRLHMATGTSDCEGSGGTEIHPLVQGSNGHQNTGSQLRLRRVVFRDRCQTFAIVSAVYILAVNK